MPLGENQGLLGRKQASTANSLTLLRRTTAGAEVANANSGLCRSMKLAINPPGWFSDPETKKTRNESKIWQPIAFPPPTKTPTLSCPLSYLQYLLLPPAGKPTIETFWQTEKIWPRKTSTLQSKGYHFRPIALPILFLATYIFGKWVRCGKMRVLRPVDP
jgi:hypothetical protein